MRTLKSLLLLFSIVALVISSCSSNIPVAIPTDTAAVSPTTISIYTPMPTYTPTLTPTNIPVPTISKTKIELSPELYLDENSSPDNLLGEPYHLIHDDFSNLIESEGKGWGSVYNFGNEEWVVALTWTRIFPFDDNLHPNEGELRQHYVQVWRDGKMLYSFPVDGIGYEAKSLLRYDDHWIFWFMDLNTNLGQVVQDGISLNDLHEYDSAFSLFLLDGKPFFFFQRGDRYGVSFNNQEVLLPYPNVSYGRVCCEGGGKGSWNPRGTDIMIGFYVQREDNKYQYIEIGLR